MHFSGVAAVTEDQTNICSIIKTEFFLNRLSLMGCFLKFIYLFRWSHIKNIRMMQLFQLLPQSNCLHKLKPPDFNNSFVFKMALKKSSEEFSLTNLQSIPH